MSAAVLPMLSLELEVLENPAQAFADGMLYVCAVVCVVGGIIAAIARHTLWPLGFVALGIYLYGYLLRLPQRPCRVVQYLTLDDRGIQYIHASPGRDRVSRYAWSEMERVELIEGEVSGLHIWTRRPGFSGVPITLWAPPSHAEAARDVAQGWLAASATARGSLAP